MSKPFSRFLQLTNLNVTDVAKCLKLQGVSISRQALMKYSNGKSAFMRPDVIEGCDRILRLRGYSEGMMKKLVSDSLKLKDNKNAEILKIIGGEVKRLS